MGSPLLTVEVEDSDGGLRESLVRVGSLANEAGVEMLSEERRVLQVIDQDTILPINR